MEDIPVFGNYVSNVEFLLENNLLNKSDIILEIGSGKGALLKFLLDKGYLIEGVEISKEYVEYSKAKLGKQFPVNLIEDWKLPYPDNTFDKVISFDVLEHIPETDQHLQEVHRVLKKNGKYCFGIPNKLTDEPFCIYAYKSFTKYKQPGHHCSLHSYWGIKRRLKKSQFDNQLYNQRQDTEWLRNKIKRFGGKKALNLVKKLKVDSWPIWLKPTLYVVAIRISKS